MPSRWIWWRRRKDADFHDEIQAHIDLEADRLRAEGVDSDEARYAARRAFGNLLAAEERFYDKSRWMWLDQLRQDARYAICTLWRSRAFAGTAVLTLAIALGLVTVLFAVFNAYVLRPFAIHDPHRVYAVGLGSGGDFDFRFTWREYQEIARRRDLFDSAAAHRWHMISTTDRQVHAAFVSGNYFDTLRPHLRLGRAIAAFDAPVPGAAPVAVLSDQAWAMLFNRDPNVLGRRLDLNGHGVEIIGVVRPEFSGMDDSPLDVWLPLTMLPAIAGRNIYDASEPSELTIFGRLRADVTRVQAEQALAAFAYGAARARAQAGRAVKPENTRLDLQPRTTPNPLTLGLVAMLSPIFAAFGLVLVAACANVSSVMLARALVRQREIGIRLSVGASRGRIVRQLLTEALIISTLAGLLGIALADGVLRTGRQLFFASLPASLVDLARIVPLDFDVRVFAFGLAVATAATQL